MYDSDPRLIDAELDHYLKVTADDIKRNVARYLDVSNRVVLDIVPAAGVEEAEAATPASAQPPSDPHQPASPAPQVPEVPSSEPASPVHAGVPEIKPPSASTDTPKDPADVPSQTKPGSGPLHP